MTTRYYHFRLDFYENETSEEPVYSFSSEDYWPFFSFNGNATQRFWDSGNFDFSSSGVGIEEGDSLIIWFELPPDAPDFLYNRLWYVKWTPYISSSRWANAYADIIFVVDESGSMKDAHDWLPGAIRSLDTRLFANGIHPNRYKLVGFGGQSYSPQPSREITFGWNTADAIADSISELEQAGGIEDGYAALKRSVQGVEFREGAVPRIIFITDEDRDIRDPTVSLNDLLDIFNPRIFLGFGEGGTPIYNTDRCFIPGIISGILNVSITSSSGESLFGFNYFDGVGYKSSGTSYVTISEGGRVNSAFGNVRNHYLKLLNDSRGVQGNVWDLNILQQGGDVVESFTEAFVDSTATGIEKAFITDSSDFRKTFVCPKNYDETIINIPFVPSSDDFEI